MPIFSRNTLHINMNTSSFGMIMPTRSYSATAYRYGFQGQEKDDEVSGDGNSYTADFWKYDSRTARRWEIDPVVKYHESSYAAFANNPIWFNDFNGADTGLVILFEHHGQVNQQKSALVNDDDNKNYGVYVATSFADGLAAATKFAETYGATEKIGIVFRYHGVNDPNGGVMTFVGDYVDDPNNEGELKYDKDHSLNSTNFTVFTRWMSEAKEAGKEFNLDYIKNVVYADEGVPDQAAYDGAKTMILPMMGIYKLGKSLDDNDMCAFTHCNLGYGTKGKTTAKALGAMMPNTSVYINVGATKTHWDIENTENYGILDLPMATGYDGSRGWMVVQGTKIKTRTSRSIVLNSTGRLIGWHRYKGKSAFALDKNAKNAAAKIMKKKYP
jgi:hypothetical protein